VVITAEDNCYCYEVQRVIYSYSTLPGVKVQLTARTTLYVILYTVCCTVYCRLYCILYVVLYSTTGKY